MGRFIDLTGLIFGRWHVLSRSEENSLHPKWKCRCDCGTIRVVSGGNLKSGRSYSCGCFHKENIVTVFKTHGYCIGGDIPPEYHIWRQMRERCEKPNKKGFNNYGGRGIKVCKRWQKFEAFFKDMGARPSKEHSLDRIDNDGPYSPENCRWATLYEQSRNKRTNHILTFGEQSLTITDWATKMGTKGSVLFKRLQRGWSIEQTLSIPIKHTQRGRIEL